MGVYIRIRVCVYVREYGDHVTILVRADCAYACLLRASYAIKLQPSPRWRHGTVQYVVFWPVVRRIVAGVTRSNCSPYRDTYFRLRCRVFQRTKYGYHSVQASAQN